MAVFISWSGDASHQIALALYELIGTVVQSAKPWLSAEDIAAGSVWSDEISGSLQSASFGVICLTPDNLNSPWIHYEAGALAVKVTKPRVCPMRFNLEPTDIAPPLGRFQSKKLDRDGVWALVMSINQTVSDPVPERNLVRAFDGAWEGCAAALALVRMQGPAPAPRPAAELMGEILQNVLAVRNHLEAAEQEQSRVTRMREIILGGYEPGEPPVWYRSRSSPIRNAFSGMTMRDLVDPVPTPAELPAPKEKKQTSPKK